MIRRITGYLWRIWERFSILGQLDAEIAAANREIDRCRDVLRELGPQEDAAKEREAKYVELFDVLRRIANMARTDNVHLIRDPKAQFERIYNLAQSAREDAPT